MGNKAAELEFSRARLFVEAPFYYPLHSGSGAAHARVLIHVALFARPVAMGPGGQSKSSNCRLLPHTRTSDNNTYSPKSPVPSYPSCIVHCALAGPAARLTPSSNRSLILIYSYCVSVAVVRPRLRLLIVPSKGHKNNRDGSDTDADR